MVDKFVFVDFQVNRLLFIGALAAVAMTIATTSASAFRFFRGLFVKHNYRLKSLYLIMLLIQIHHFLKSVDLTIPIAVIWHLGRIFSEWFVFT